MWNLHRLCLLYVRFSYVYLQVYLTALILGLWESVCDDEVALVTRYVLFGSESLGEGLERVGGVLHCALLPMASIGLVLLAVAIAERYRPGAKYSPSTLVQALYGVLCLLAIPVCAAAIYWGTDDSYREPVLFTSARIGATLVLNAVLGLAIRRLIRGVRRGVDSIAS